MFFSCGNKNVSSEHITCYTYKDLCLGHTGRDKNNGSKSKNTVYSCLGSVLGTHIMDHNYL